MAPCDWMFCPYFSPIFCRISCFFEVRTTRGLCLERRNAATDGCALRPPKSHQLLSPPEGRGARRSKFEDGGGGEGKEGAGGVDWALTLTSEILSMWTKFGPLGDFSATSAFNRRPSRRRFIRSKLGQQQTSRWARKCPIVWDDCFASSSSEATFSCRCMSALNVPYGRHTRGAEGVACYSTGPSIF